MATLFCGGLALEASTSRLEQPVEVQVHTQAFRAATLDRVGKVESQDSVEYG